MDRDEALRLLNGGKQGVEEWNQRREIERNIPDISGADISGAQLLDADLSHVNLRDVDLSDADLTSA